MIRRLLLETPDGAVFCGSPITHIGEGWQAAVDTNQQYALSFVESLDDFFANKSSSVPVTVVVIEDARQYHINGGVDRIYFTSTTEKGAVVKASFRIRLEDGSLADVALDFRNGAFTARHGTNRQLSL